MDKKVKSKLKMYMQSLAADKLKRSRAWNGYKVYMPVYRKSVETGLPRMILEKDGVVRLSSYEEYFLYVKETRKVKVRLCT